MDWYNWSLKSEYVTGLVMKCWRDPRKKEDMQDSEVPSNEKNKKNTLTKKLVLLRSKVNSLDEVRNLNLWGCKLSNISIVEQLVYVCVISLSVNEITTLSPFQFCKSLCQLYLRDNKILHLEEVGYLVNLKKLSILWLSENPIANDIQLYRTFVIQALPQLTTLDDYEISAQEVAMLSNIYSPTLALLHEKMDMIVNGNSPGDIPVNNQEEIIKPILSKQEIIKPTSSKQEIMPLQQPELPAVAEKQFKKMSDNMLVAVFSLLEVLDEPSLRAVRKKCKTILSKKKEVSNLSLQLP